MLILKNQRPSKFIALIHSSLGGIRLLIALTWLALGNIAPLYLLAIGCFLIAVLGGMTMFGLNTGKHSVPKWLALLHPFFVFGDIILLDINLAKQSS